MPRCPVCDSGKVLVVLDERRRATCLHCGARWVQDGAAQSRIEFGALQPTTVTR